MDEPKFNLYKLCLCEKDVALPLLQLLFVTLWDKTFPNEKWEWNHECVRLFEERNDDVFLRTGARRKRNHNRMSLEWDIGKLAKAVIHSRLFDLATESVSCVERIRNWRNDLAHSGQTKCTSPEFTAKLQDLKAAVNGLSTEIDVGPFTSRLSEIETMELPSDHKEVRRLLEECVALYNELLFRAVSIDSTELGIMKSMSRLEESLKNVEKDIGLLKEKLEQFENIRSQQEQEPRCCAFLTFLRVSINNLRGRNRHVPL